MPQIELEALFILLAVGLIAGWLAGMLTQGGGFGIIGNIVVGIVGAFIGFYLLRTLNIAIAPGLLGNIITATIGAVILLLIIGLLRR